MASAGLADVVEVRALSLACGLVVLACGLVALAADGPGADGRARAWNNRPEEGCDGGIDP